MLQILFCIAFCSFLFIGLLGQEIDNNTVLQELSESAQSQNEEQSDLSEISETMLYYTQNPLDLNNASEEDFEKLGLLTCFKIQNIIAYRQQKGHFLSAYELNGVDGLSTEDVRILLPFIKVMEGETIKQQKSKLLQQMAITSGRSFPLARGYTNLDSSSNARFVGNSYFLKTRYRAEFGNLQTGFSLENDAGEPKLNSNKPIFDYYSAYLQMSNIKFVRNFVLGDYTANFGQGLVLWNGFSAGRNAYAVNIRKWKEGFSHYSSMDENRYMRGLASSFRVWDFNLSAFASAKHIDATMGDTTANGELFSVSSFKTSGLHVLPTDIRDKKLLGEKTIGGNITFDRKYLKIGATVCNTNYSVNFKPDDALYNYYKFSGKSWNAGGVNYLLRGRKFDLFGEFAYSSNGGKAVINGIQAQLLPEVSFALLYRNFDAGYYSAYANSFAQNSATNNESGIYMGLDFNPLAFLRISAYADFYRNPWLKYQIDEPTNGAQYFIETTFLQNALNTFSIRFTYSVNPEKNIPLAPLPVSVSEQTTQKIRLHASFKISSAIELRNRFEIAIARNDSFQNNKGYLIYQDVLWKPDRASFTLAIRYAIFSTSDWDTRIYAYENDVLYGFSIPAYSGKGSRFYVLGRYSISKSITFLARASLFSYLDRSTIGTGAYTIDGSRKTDVTCQLLFRF